MLAQTVNNVIQYFVLALNDSISKTSILSADGWSFAIGLESEHLKLLNDELLRHFQEEYTEGSLSEELEVSWIVCTCPHCR